MKTYEDVVAEIKKLRHLGITDNEIAAKLMRDKSIDGGVIFDAFGDPDSIP
jgi:hypothetical protein